MLEVAMREMICAGGGAANMKQKRNVWNARNKVSKGWRNLRKLRFGEGEQPRMGSPYLRVACWPPRSPSSASDRAGTPDPGALPPRCRWSGRPAWCRRRRCPRARCRSNSRSWRAAGSGAARASVPRPTTPARRSPSRRPARSPPRSCPRAPWTKVDRSLRSHVRSILRAAHNLPLFAQQPPCLGAVRAVLPLESRMSLALEGWVADLIVVAPWSGFIQIAASV